MFCSHVRVCSYLLFRSSGLLLWYPEIVNQLAEHEMKYPGTSITVCEAISFARRVNTTHIVPCSDAMDSSVFQQNLIIGVAYAVGFIAITLIVNKLGKRTLLGISISRNNFDSNIRLYQYNLDSTRFSPAPLTYIRIYYSLYIKHQVTYELLHYNLLCVRFSVQLSRIGRMWYSALLGDASSSHWFSIYRSPGDIRCKCFYCQCRRSRTFPNIFKVEYDWEVKYSYMYVFLRTKDLQTMFYLPAFVFQYM